MRRSTKTNFKKKFNHGEEVNDKIKTTWGVSQSQISKIFFNHGERVKDKITTTWGVSQRQI